MGVLSEINLADDDDDNSYVYVNRRNSCIYLRLRSVIIRANTFISTVAVLVCRCLFVFMPENHRHHTPTGKGAKCLLIPNSPY